MRYLIATFFALLATTFLIAQPTSVNLDFSKSGKALVNFYEQTNDSYNAVAISVTGDNQVLLAGDVYYEAVVHKIKSTGKDDMTFGSKGFRFFDFGLAGNNRIEEILNYPGAKTILIGHATPCLSSVNKYSSNSGATVIRLLANGQPDTSFGIKGKAFYLRHDLSLWAFTGLVQPDGKIVVACRGNGNIKTTAIWDKIMLIRFTASGVLDTTFGKSGFFILPQYNGCKNVLYCGKSGMALQPDGNILLGDITTEMILGNGSKSSPAVYRVTPQGKLDKTFGVNGVFVNRLGHHNYAINSVVVQPDGKIVVAGNTLSAQQTTTWLMFRLKSNGQIDSSFAQNGLFTYSGDGWTQGTIGDIAMAGNDRIIASAVHATSAGGVIDAFRLKLNGTFDSSFAQSTVIFQKTMQAGYFLSCAKMSIDTNHDLAILGYTSNFPFQNPSNIGHMVLRLSKDGIPIREFNTSGSRQYYNTQNIATTTDYNYGSTDKLTGIAQFKNGKILLAGNIFRNNETQKEIGLTRLDVKGETDSTFGIHGRVKLFPGHSQDRTKVFLKLDNDKIVMDLNDNALFRIDSTGKIDSSFGIHGIARLRLPLFNEHPQQIRSLEQQADKKILVLYDKTLMRLNLNGTVDNTFGINGVIPLNTSIHNFSGKKIRVQADGKIVVAGDVDATSTYLFRCTSSGTPDNLFGDMNNGYAPVTVNISASFELSFMDCFIDFQVLTSGKIVVLCMKDRNYGVPNPINNEIISAGSNYRDIIVYGITSDGKIDPTFGGSPLRSVYTGTCHFWLPFVEKVPAGLLVTPDGKVLIPGYFNSGNGWDVGFVQLKPNGVYDTTCLIKGVTTSGEDNILQNRFLYDNLDLKLLPLLDGTYLMGGTQLGQGADFFAINFLSPVSSYVKYNCFTASQDTSCFKVNLSWSTALEYYSDSMSIEYSTDNRVFSKIGSVKATGSATRHGNYVFSHTSAAYGNNYYRVRSGSNPFSSGASFTNKVAIDDMLIATVAWDNITETQNDSIFDLELQWNTVNENGTKNFEVQKSMDSVNFQTIRSIPANGKTVGMTNYNATLQDMKPGTYFFRIHVTGTNCRELPGTIRTVLLEKSTDDSKATPSEMVTK